MVETAHAQWKIAITRRKAASKVKLFVSFRKLMLLNPLPVTDLWPEVEFTVHAQTLLSCLKQAELDRLRVRLNIILLLLLLLLFTSLNKYKYNDTCAW